ncbi:hypothetical protein A2U01_0091834, partial [Trifolium medium]|nr:hypothetical protein [Trifolium medium]
HLATDVGLLNNKSDSESVMRNDAAMD